MMNRNKRGIALDLKSDEGKEVLRRLLAGADIVIENYRAGTMERLGFGYETLRKDNPALIYCSLSGFGRTGPYADRGGFDLIAQGMSGLMSITGEKPGGSPCEVRRAYYRYYSRHPRRHRHSRGLYSSSKDRRRTDGRYVPV